MRRRSLPKPGLVVSAAAALLIRGLWRTMTMPTSPPAKSQCHSFIHGGSGSPVGN